MWQYRTGAEGDCRLMQYGEYAKGEGAAFEIFVLIYEHAAKFPWTSPSKD
jgi:hypothetical protein